MKLAKQVLIPMAQKYFSLTAALLLLFASLFILRSMQANAQSCPTIDTSRGEAAASISINSAGTYAVWMKIASPAGTGSLNLAVGEECYKEFGSNSLVTNELTWVNTYMDGTSANKNLKTGVNVFKMAASSDKLQIDQILITDADCIPIGSGENCNPKDTTSPSITIIDPSTGQELSGDVDLHAIVSDEDTSLSVDFYIDGVKYASADKNGMSEWFVQVQTTEFANGAHTLEVRAMDSSGNQSKSEVAFSINNTSETPPPPTPTPTTTGQLKLMPTDDTFARSDKPTATNERSTLHADARPEKITYIRYEIPTGQTVTKAHLSLYALEEVKNGGRVALSTSDWSEDTLTWNNRPGQEGAAYVDIGATSTDTWVEVDVSQLLNGKTGTVSFMIFSPKNELARYNSKEKSSGESGPYLFAETKATGVATDPGSTPGTETEKEIILTDHTFKVSEDSFVRSDQPSATAATNTLHTDLSPQKIVYLKFNVADIGQSIIRDINLRLYALETASNGGMVYSVSDTSWSEKTLNWNIRPTVGGELGTVGSTSANQWLEVSLSNLAINSDGYVTLAIRSSADELARYQSKDKNSGAFAAELLITTQQ